MLNSSPLLAELLPFIAPEAKVPSRAELARLLRRQAACEIEEGGPYGPVPDGTMSDADIGLNIAVALFLRTLDVHLPKLETYIERELAREAPASRFFSAAELSGLVARYRATAPLSQKIDGPAWNDEERVILAEIHKRMDRRLAALPESFAESARRVVERTIRSNPDKQMALMPLFMRQALGKQGTFFSDAHVAERGLMNVFFWTAFIIYDDFWDEDEAAEPALLPIANLFARHYAAFFSAHASSADAGELFHSFMDQLDAANEWEITQCRMLREGDTLLLPPELPSYGGFDIKFYPAAGHIIGPVTMLLELGYSSESREVEALTEYFKHYLVAMQLNDDAHDWKEDLERGHISTAVYLLIKEWRRTHPSTRHIDLVEDITALEQLFWFKVLPRLCELIFLRTDRAQSALDELCALGCVENAEPLQQFIDKNREAAQKALAEQQESHDFLQILFKTI